MSTEGIIKSAAAIGLVATALTTSDRQGLPQSDVLAGSKSENSITTPEPEFLAKRPQLVPSAEATGNFRTFVPAAVRNGNPSVDITPTITLNPYEKMAQQTNPPVESVTGSNGGWSVVVESRRFSDSAYKIDFDDSAKTMMAAAIASDARGNFTKAGFIIGRADEFDPELASKITQEIDINTASSGQPGNPKSIGKFGVIIKDNHLYVLYAPVNFNDPNVGINLNDSLVAGRLNKAVSQAFFAAIASKGTSFDPMLLTGDLDYQSLIQQQALKVASS